MTSPHDPDAGPDVGPDAGPDVRESPSGEPPVLPPEQEREVSALLADALGRGPVTVPPEVVARLDRVLTGLVADREASPESREKARATVVPLAPRRRRLPRVLLAAAAVVVGGYAVGNLASGGSLSGGSLSGGDGGGIAADSTAGDAGGGSASQAERSESAADGRERPRRLAEDEDRPRVLRVRPDHLAADVRRVVRLVGVPGDPGRPAPERTGSVAERPDCAVRGLSASQRLYRVRYDGAPAGLVVGPRRQGQVDVTLYSCRTGGVELSRTVPAF